MRILVVCQHYYPEQFRITDICEELVKRGHSVSVITGLPNYPMGVIYDGYRNGEKRDEVINGVRVHRCFTIGRRTGVVFRVLNYYSFSLSSAWYASRLKDEFDVVLINQLSPVMMAEAGIRFRRKHGKKAVLYCMDLWPASLAVGGISEESLIYRYFHKISARIYKQVDKILITSQSFASYFSHEFHIEDTQYLPQYAEELFSAERCVKTPNETVDLMFAGNIGVAQSVDTIINAARLTQDIQNLRWHIVGDGSELDRCKRLVEKAGIESVVFHGRQPLDAMPEFYSKADAMLVTMNEDKIAEMTLPGKVQTYMMAEKPILCAVNGEARSIISDAACGYCCDAADAEGLAQAARDFCELSQEERGRLGARAKQYCAEHFSKTVFFDALSAVLEQYGE